MKIKTVLKQVIIICITAIVTIGLLGIDFMSDSNPGRMENYYTFILKLEILDNTFLLFQLLLISLFLLYTEHRYGLKNLYHKGIKLYYIYKIWLAQYFNYGAKELRIRQERLQEYESRR